MERHQITKDREKSKTTSEVIKKYLEMRLTIWIKRNFEYNIMTRDDSYT